MRPMIAISDRRVSVPALPRHANWRGRSGRFYALTPVRIDSFALTDAALFLLARGSVPVWVGAADDVVNDAASRARFRLALEAADRAFRVSTDDGDLARMTTVWDLEGAEPVSALSAA